MSKNNFEPISGKVNEGDDIIKLWTNFLKKVNVGDVPKVLCSESTLTTTVFEPQSLGLPTDNDVTPITKALS